MPQEADGKPRMEDWAPVSQRKKYVKGPLKMARRWGFLCFLKLKNWQWGGKFDQLAQNHKYGIIHVDKNTFPFPFQVKQIADSWGKSHI